MVKFKLEEFEVIGLANAKILEEKLNIKDVDDFFSTSIQEITLKSGIEQEKIKQYSEILELIKIPNLSIRNAELLNYININSIEELSHRQSIRIYYKLKELETKTYIIILQLPTFAQIDEWIYHAKLMTKRIKYGLNVPLILLPMINIDQASELQKYQIRTIENFQSRKSLIPGLRRRLNMSKNDYNTFLNYIDLIDVDGIDVYFADCLFKAGIKTRSDLKSLSTEEIFSKVNSFQSMEKNMPELFSKEIISKIKSRIAEHIGGTA